MQKRRTFNCEYCVHDNNNGKDTQSSVINKVPSGCTIHISKEMEGLGNYKLLLCCLFGTGWLRMTAPTIVTDMKVFASFPCAFSIIAKGVADLALPGPIFLLPFL